MLLQAKGIEKSYISKTSEENVLQGIDLSINENDFVLITGPSGAGKSTLLHILGGLDTPTKGNVLLEGNNFPYDKEEEMAYIRKKKFGFIFQFHYLLPEFTVLENLIIAAGSLNDKNVKDKAVSLLKRVNLDKRMNGFPNELSGGEKQRLATIRAFINDPKIIFADEPTGNLDAQNRKIIYDLLCEFVKEQNKILVLVTHDENASIPYTKKFTIVDGKFYN